MVAVEAGQQLSNELYGDVVSDEQRSAAEEHEAKLRRSQIAILETNGTFEIPEHLGGGVVKFRREITFGESLHLQELADSKVSDREYNAQLLRYRVKNIAIGGEEPHPLEDPLDLSERLGWWVVGRLSAWMRALAWEADEAGKGDAPDSD